jgi:hypothetical protein
MIYFFGFYYKSIYYSKITTFPISYPWHGIRSRPSVNRCVCVAPIHHSFVPALCIVATARPSPTRVGSKAMLAQLPRLAMAARKPPLGRGRMSAPRNAREARHGRRERAGRAWWARRALRRPYPAPGVQRNEPPGGNGHGDEGWGAGWGRDGGGAGGRFRSTQTPLPLQGTGGQSASRNIRWQLRWTAYTKRLFARAAPCRGVGEGSGPAGAVLQPPAPGRARAHAHSFLIASRLGALRAIGTRRKRPAARKCGMKRQ